MPHRRTIGTRHFHHAFIFVALGGACRSVIRQVCEVDPLVCRGCSVAIRLLGFIEPPEVIAQIRRDRALGPAPVPGPPTLTAAGVFKGNKALLDVVDEVLDEAHRSGLIAGAIERAGLSGVDVAPPRDQQKR